MAAPGTSDESGRLLPLDGVRGIAILLVFVYHALRHVPHTRMAEHLMNQGVMAGWAGVDLFFVLSGFLITGILLDGKGREGYFARFYVRRVLRILPLYVVFVVFALHVAPVIGLVSPAEAARFPRLEPWYWTHTVNVLVSLEGWKGPAQSTGHLWSLAVEEQFYLLWPAIILLLARKEMLWLLAAMIVGAPALRIALIAQHVAPTTIYVLLPTRMDALAAGAALAVAFREPALWQRCRQWAIPVGAIAALVIAGVTYHLKGFAGGAAATQIFGYSAVAMLAGATIVAAISAPSGSLRWRVWAHPALRFCGRYSYGMYVWHVIVLETLREALLVGGDVPIVAGSRLPGDALFVAVTGTATIGVALVSWHLVEKPFLQLKRFVPYHLPGRSTTRSENDPCSVPSAANL